MSRQELRALLRSGSRDFLVAMRKRIKAERARSRLWTFFQQAWLVMKPGERLEEGWHIEAMCDHIQWQLEDRARATRWIADHPAHEGDLPDGVAMRAQDLAINVPPRSLKTAVLTCATAWAWLRWPTLHMMYMSTNPEVAQTSARQFRDLVTSEWYRESFDPAWEIRGDQEALSAIGNTAGGVRRARGLAAKVTGSGTAWLIIDDPHDLKDSEDAIASTVDDYKGAVHNRINDPRTSIRTLIMQRVDAKDLAAAHSWHFVIFPMEYEPGRVGGEGKYETVYGFRDPREDAWRAANDNQLPYTPETIHPRFTKSFLDGERVRLLGTRAGFAGQMQQRPSPAGGGMFKLERWRFWKPDGVAGGVAKRPDGCYDGPARTVPIVGGRGGHPAMLAFDWVELWVDCAFKGEKTSDRVSLQLVGGIGVDRFVILDSTKNRDIVATLADILKMTSRNAAEYSKRIAAMGLAGMMPEGDTPMGLVEMLPGIGHMIPLPQRALIEDKANGPACIRLLQGKVAGLTPYNPGSDSKESRARAIVPGHAAGQYYVLEGAEWVPEYVGEFADFPNGKHDDRIDGFDQGINFHVEDLSGMEHAEAGAKW